MDRKLQLAILLSFLSLTAFGQANDFNNKPWSKEKYPIIIDAYQGNDIDFNKLVTDKRVVGIIHKASQGLTIDKKYATRREEAAEKGLLFASYHLGTNLDPIEQADFYIKNVKDKRHQPMALDIEDIGGNNISLQNAEKFIKRIYERTGKYPFVYVNNKVFNEINLKYTKKSVFAKCPLWYARFVTELPRLNNKVWDKVTVWQFSCELNCKKTGDCLYNVPGTAFDMDINAFNGSLAELQLLWASQTQTKEKQLNSFVSTNMKKSSRTKIEYLGAFCNNQDTYFVQLFNADGEIKDRAFVYAKNGRFRLSRKFIFWVAENPFISYNHKSNTLETDKDIERLEITYDGYGKFSVKNLDIIESKEQPKELSGQRVFLFKEFFEDINDCL